MKKNQGFTLIELLLYIAILSIVVVAVVQFGTLVITNSSKSATQEEVYSNGRYIAEKIKYEIRNATSITTVSANSIVLGAKTISLSGSNIQLNGVNLNSADVAISNLTFTNNSSGDNKTKNISFTFTATWIPTSARQEYTLSQTYQGSAEFRSN